MLAVPTLPGGATTHYAMGWFIGTNITWHNGEVLGFHNMNAAFSDGYTVVVLGNEDLLTGGDKWIPEKLALDVHAVLNPALGAALGM